MLSAGGTKRHTEPLAPSGSMPPIPASGPRWLGCPRRDLSTSWSARGPIRPRMSAERNRAGPAAWRRYAGSWRRARQAVARRAGERALGREKGGRRAQCARALRAALGGLKGPLMKVAQMLATIPDALPAGICRRAASIAGPALRPWAGHSSSGAWPPSLGRTGRSRYRGFEREAAAAASLGQVHRAQAHGWGRLLAVQTAISRYAIGRRGRSTGNSGVILAIYGRVDRGHRHRRNSPGDRRAIARGAGLRARIPAHPALRKDARTGAGGSMSPEVLAELTTKRLLTMTWIEGPPVAALALHKAAAGGAQQSRRGAVSRLVPSLLPLRHHSWRPASRQLQGVGRIARVNLLDLRLRPHLQAKLRARRDRALSRALCGG